MNDEWHLPNCDTCLERVPEHTRRDLGCVFLARKEGEKPGAVPLSDKVPGLDYCPNGAIELPEVLDVADVFYHVKLGTGSLALPAEGSPALKTALRVLGSSVNACEAYFMKHPRKKGGT